MAKPTTGHVEYVPEHEPDTDQMATDTLMTSVFSGISLIPATLVLATFASVGATLGSGLASPSGAKIGLAVGLAVGMVLIALGLRRYSDRIRGRSQNLYRGAWIGSIASLVIIAALAFMAQPIPQYCPPGHICTDGQR